MLVSILKFQFAKDKHEQKNKSIKTSTVLFISIILSVVQSKTSVTVWIIIFYVYKQTPQNIFHLVLFRTERQRKILY